MHSAETQVDVPTTARSPLLWVALAAVLGIVADRYGLADPVGGHLFWWATTAIAIVACVLLRRCRAYRRSAYLALLAVFSLAGAWHHLHWNYVANDSLARFASESSQPVCVEVVAIDRTKFSPAPPKNILRALPAGPRSEVEVRIARIRDGTEWRTASGISRLRIAGRLSGIDVGDRLVVFAHFARPQPVLNPGQYDWAEAARGAGRHCELFCGAPECVTVVGPAVGASVGGWLGAAANQCKAQLARYVGAEQSDLALAILLGEREHIGRGTFESFFKTGTVHLLVVSGLHIGMLAGFVWLIVRSGFLPQSVAIALAVGGVVAYASIAGGRPPVVRATVVIVLTFVALQSGRRPFAGNLLAAAAIGVLAYNPSELFRSGTQLSFLCVAALASYGARFGRPKPVDPLQRLILSRESWFWKALRKLGKYYGHIVMASLVLWLAAAPLVAYHFNIATPVGILITPIIWPLVAVTLATGFLICTFGWIVPPVALLLGAVCAFCLGTIRAVVDLAEQSGIGSIYLPGPAVWWLLGFYGAMALLVLFPAIRIGWKVQVSLAALWIAVGLVAGVANRQDDQLRCTFLAVGHGTCVVLELPGNQTILYDAGSLGSPEYAADTIAGYLWSRGITRIDAVVLSHADVDHYNAVPQLLERFEMGVVYVSPMMFDPWATAGQLDAPEFLRATLNDAGIPLREVWMNDRLLTASLEVEIEVLHPPQFGTAGRDNANSILLFVKFACQSILLPGDLESPGIEAVVAESPLDCDILMAPHHGSSRSDPPGFAAWCTPNWVVVSGRHRSADQQVTVASYRGVGAEVLHTADRGAATFTLSEQGIEMSTFREMNR
ncbi:MAG: ComEC/Rec2 family competence protein [Planctomycetes bacterium]|nr:ComEC/Rec2 family competence protein [Planctomycetota bacterium]